MNQILSGKPGAVHSARNPTINVSGAGSRGTMWMNGDRVEAGELVAGAYYLGIRSGPDYILFGPNAGDIQNRATRVYADGAEALADLNNLEDNTRFIWQVDGNDLLMRDREDSTDDPLIGSGNARWGVIARYPLDLVDFIEALVLPPGEGADLDFVVERDDPVWAFGVVDDEGHVAFGVKHSGSVHPSGGGDVGPSPSANNAGNTAAIKDGVAYLPAPSGLVVVEFETDEPIPTGKGPEPEGTFRVTVDGARFDAFGTIRVSGSSSQKWPKTTWRLRFYSDEEHEEPIELKFGNDVPSNRWVAKSEWVDSTMMRSVLYYRLFDQVIETRKTLPKHEVDNAWWGKNNMEFGLANGGTGIPRTHLGAMYINGEFYGVVQLQMKDDPASYNLHPNNPDHIYFEFDARLRPVAGHPLAGNFELEKNWTKFTGDAIDKDTNPVGEWIKWEFPKWKSIDAGVQQSIRNAIDAAGAVINGSQSNFNANVDTYFDRQNLIDYFLMTEMSKDYDAVTQDIMVVSYNMQRFYFLPWDKDTTFGAHHGGGLSNNANGAVIGLDEEFREHILWQKMYHCDPSAVETRWAELRESVFTAENILAIIMRETARVPKVLWDSEDEKWSSQPLNGAGEPDPEGYVRDGRLKTSSHQLWDWCMRRITFLDNRFNYTP